MRSGQRDGNSVQGVHPLLVGSGRRLFPDDDVMRTLRLTSSAVIPGGVIAATYEPAR